MDLIDALPTLPSILGEEAKHSASPVALHLDGALLEGGSLTVTTNAVYWLAAGAGGGGYRVGFKSLAMHAISRSAEVYASPCIYCQIEQDPAALGTLPAAATTAAAVADVEAAAAEDAAAAGDGGEGEDEDEPANFVEVRLVPSGAADLDAIYAALCECATLNPSDDEGGDDEGGEGAFFFGDGGLAAGLGEVEEQSLAEQNLAKYERLLVESEAGAFEDAEED